MSRKMGKKAETKTKTNMKKAAKRNETVNTAKVAANTAPTGTTTNGQTPDQGQVIPFRQPGWDKHNPWLANQQVKQATGGFAPVSQRFNHSRGK